jgi:dinuclear metal center YbgI/SA1388 family protein
MNSIKLHDILSFLEKIYPSSLASSWDNVGLLIGDSTQNIKNIMTCLTLTSNVAHEAISSSVDLILSHHPLLFHKTQSITDQTVEGKIILSLIQNQINVVSLHTRYDQAPEGINQTLAKLLELKNIENLQKISEKESAIGVLGYLNHPKKTSDLGKKLIEFIDQDFFSSVLPNQIVRKIAIVCGSGGSLLDVALKNKCDLFITGEMSFHQCLKAEESKMSVLLLSHYGSEKFALKYLSKKVKENLDIQVFDSQEEKNPLHLLTPFRINMDTKN